MISSYRNLKLNCVIAFSYVWKIEIWSLV